MAAADTGGVEGGMEVPESPETQAATVEEISVDGSEPELEADEAAGAEGGAGKKKKKKKKKNKKKQQSGENCEEGQHEDHVPKQKQAMTAEEKQEADKRFNSTLNELRANDEMALWASLSNCNLTDSKLKKLANALKGNNTVTSIDISDNNITDDGLQQLVSSMIVEDAAPELISLNVSRNRLTDVSNTILNGLMALRKKLQVENEAEALDEELEPEICGSVDDILDLVSGGDNSGPVVDLGKRTRLAEEHFQGPDEDEDEEGEDQLPAQDLWERIQVLADSTDLDLSELGWALNTAAECIGDEMANCSTPLLPSTMGVELLPHSRSAAENVALLSRILELEPPPGVNQHSHGAEVPRVGIHRVAAANVVAQLLRGRAPCTDLPVCADGFVPKVLRLTLTHPTCSALQSVSLRILQASLCSPVPGLWEPLLGSNANGDEQPSLQSSIAKIAEEAENIPIGKRSALSGFAIGASQLLQAASNGQDATEAAADAGPTNLSPTALFQKLGEMAMMMQPVSIPEMKPPEGVEEHLSEALNADQVWTQFSGSDGALARLLAVQQLELGGPRPGSGWQDDDQQMVDIASLIGGGLLMQP